MALQSRVGSQAGSFKYDLLTMLSVAGLHGTPTFQTSMTRLIALVTARYNWRLDELTVGQRDIARMWAVNERTVKREMKRLTEAGVLVCKRTGVRGRVGAYRLNFTEIARISEPSWESVGPDFAYRMSERHAPPVTNVVQLKTIQRPKVAEGDDPWSLAMAQLCEQQPGLWNAWFSKLTFLSLSDAVLRVDVPNAFLQRYIETHLIDVLLSALVPHLGEIMRVEIQLSGTRAG